MFKILACCLVATTSALTACGDDGPGGVTSAKLTGYWNLEGDLQHGQTIMGFVAAEDVLVDIEPSDIAYPTGKDLSTVYQKTLSQSSPTLFQVATYSVEEGALLQTVVGDVNVPPGTMYSTKIFDFDGDTLTLESTNDASGMRTYTHSEACPNELQTGWYVAGQSDIASDPSYHSPSIAIADDGHVYSLLGAYADTATAFPRFQDMSKGCVALMEVAPMFRMSAIVVMGAEIHTFYDGMGAPDDSAIIHRWRVSRTAPWQSERIAEPPSISRPQEGKGIYNLFAFADGNKLVVVASRTNGALEIYKHDAAGWTTTPIATTDFVRAESAAIGPSGEVVVFGLNEIVRFRGSTGEHIPLPQGQLDYTINGGVQVASDGAIHAVWGHTVVSNSGYAAALRTVYGIYDGTWKQTELGPMMYARPIAPHNGTLRVISGKLKDSQSMVLLQIAPDGTQTSENIGADDNLDVSPKAYRRMATAEGKDGSLAASFDARFVFVKRPKPMRAPQMIKLTINITGQGHVYTTDHSIDCTQTCTTMVPEGTRIQLHKDDTPKMGYDSSCPFGDAYQVEGYCWHDVVRDSLSMPEASTSFVFP